MLRDRLKKLFGDCDPEIQQIILEVLEFEQRHISRKQPRFSEPLDDIITRIAQRELERDDVEDVTSFEYTTE